MDQRIKSLPRRDWESTADVDRWTRELRTRNGAGRLRAIQAAALGESRDTGGLFLHGRVGCGKTLIAGLLPVVHDLKRPVLIVRGADVADTEKAHARLRVDWQIPRHVQIVGYEFIAHPTRADWLKRYAPDGLICDEGHKLRNIDKSSAAMQVDDCLREDPSRKFFVMSGTLTPHGDLLDYWHLVIWALRNRSPVPLDKRQAKSWQRAMMGTGDARVLGGMDREEALANFKERFASTPGVIVSRDRFEGPLSFDLKLHDAPEATREIYAKLRNLWEAPDGWSYGDDVFQVAEAARQFANGFSYRHDPRPPKPFLAARKAWTNFCRQMVETGQARSEGVIKLRLRSGDTKDGAEELAAWEKAEAEFPLRTVASWHDATALLYARDWMAKTKRKGIVWVSHLEFGHALSRLSGAPFYCGDSERSIMEETGERCVIASIDACGTSKNLQHAFCHNLVMQPPANNETNEQMIGRTHREGQKDEVTMEYYMACREQRNAVVYSIQKANRIDASLAPQKLTGLKEPDDSEQDHPAWDKAHRVDAEEAAQ